MWLICGLWNPGSKFTNTRHNIGFASVEKIIEVYNFEILKKNKSYELYKGKIKNNSSLICKPLSFMNLSGEPIYEIKKFYKIINSKIIVIHDDIDLFIGKMKLKLGGGNGGHNGLLSIDSMIGKSYNRLRIGVGHPGSKELVNKYVLSKIQTDEKKIYINLIENISKNFDLIFDNQTLFLNRISQKKEN